MHELALTQSIVDACTERAGGHAVARVTIEVGCLAAVAPDALRFCYDVCAEGTPLAGSELEIVMMPARARCLDCGTDLQPRGYLALCDCGSCNLEYHGGDELKIRHMELV